MKPPSPPRLVVHLAITPLAGAPWRICRSVSAHTTTTCRLITARPDAYGPRRYPGDLNWSDPADQAEARELLEAADLVVCHNQVGPETEHFEGLSLADLLADGTPMVRQFHSPPDFLARTGPWPDEHALMSGRDDPLPALVIAQGQERFYPSAIPVPNIPDVTGQPWALPRNRPLRLAFAPTSDLRADADRWSTKGAPETVAILESLAAEMPDRLEIDVLRDCPFEETIRRRAAADLNLDEVVTGNVHLSSLESLALGRPTLALLDDRTCDFLCAHTGAAELPWINTSLESLESVLRELLENPDRLAEIGAQGAAWMRRYWNPAETARQHVRAWMRVLAGDPPPPRFDPARYADWWDAFGRVERTRQSRHASRLTEAERLLQQQRLARLRQVCEANRTHPITILTDGSAEPLRPLQAFGASLRVVETEGRESPEMPPGEILISDGLLAHRTPESSRRLLHGLVESASDRVILCEQFAKPGVPSGFRLDHRGGSWNHDRHALTAGLDAAPIPGCEAVQILTRNSRREAG